MPSILAVDNSQVALNFIRAAFSHEGYSVALAASAAEAIKALDTVRPDVILLDLEMPEMSGLELCRRLKSDNMYRITPIIVLTARSDTEHLLEAINAGADDFIPKGTDLPILKAKVAAMVRLRKVHEELGQLRRVEGIRQIVATYNHEFNNPLTIVIGNLSCLRTGVTDAENLKRVERAYDASLRMSEIVKKIRQLRDYVDSAYADGEMILDITANS